MRQHRCLALSIYLLLLAGCRAPEPEGSRGAPPPAGVPPAAEPEEEMRRENQPDIAAIFRHPMQEPIPGAREPARRTERLMFVCDWTPERPTAERIVADVRLRSGDANRVPTDQELEALRRAGARILHVFNVAMVRAEISTDRIPALIRSWDPIAEWAATVPDPDNFDVELQIFFVDAPRDEDLRAIEALGGRVRGGLGVRGVLYVVAPDAAVPQLARLPRVTNVRAQAMICAEALGVEATPRHNPGPR
ncbi:hypothetical protein BH20GEM2_BH20GEM2_07290 [soil metagenome]